MISNRLPQIVLNIDIAPTLLDIAGIKVPEHMDGVSFLPYIRLLKNRNSSELHRSKLIKRDTFLVERGFVLRNFLLKNFPINIFAFIQISNRKFQTTSNNNNNDNNIDRLLMPIVGKKQWLQLHCLKSEYQSPCRPNQRFECFINNNGVQRIRKCPSFNRKHFIRSKKNSQGQCICPPLSTRSLKRNSDSTRIGKLDYKRRLKKMQLRQQKHAIRSNLLNRARRSDKFVLSILDDGLSIDDDFDVQGVYELKKLIEISKSSSSLSNNNHSNHDNRLLLNNNLANITTSQLISILDNNPDDDTFADLANYTDYMNRTFCTVTRSNFTIECSEEIYSNHQAWREKKDFINAAIIELQRRLYELKGIRRYINQNRPLSSAFTPTFSGKKSNQTTINEENECFCPKSIVTTTNTSFIQDKDDDSETDNIQNSDNNYYDDYYSGKENVSDLYHDVRIGQPSMMMVDSKHSYIDGNNHNHNYAGHHHHHPHHRTSFDLKRWLRRREKKIRRKDKFAKTECKMAVGGHMNCFTHDNDHWKTPPLWTSKCFFFFLMMMATFSFCFSFPSKNPFETHNCHY